MEPNGKRHLQVLVIAKFADRLGSMNPLAGKKKPLNLVQMKSSRTMLLCKAALLSFRYYEGSDSLCSFFITSTSPNGWDFIILIQSTIEHQKEDSDNHPSSYFSSWNSVHKGNVKLDEGSKCCEYKLRSSVAVRSKKTCEKERENEAADSSNWNAPTLYQSLHLKHIGTLLESSESKLRLSILDIHSQAPSIALKSAFKFQSIGLSPKAMNPACQSEFLRKVQSRNATEQS
ncbi:hypothetical protein DI09_31p110 [Mitosporidium daphniae]|uniref:F-actin-capping protein subunit beta n=1 Tax=Mitosporidium daphniae TaxID=1485682 RepID=A0A098VRG7_9MICR|nr:uncharacterized protein DI09_31p110 [Mitosporidium daphniae]KGG51560.1 hypothetical protein DI09_31p110 [Mitosporidium daphniae]|eukprot:XP_013237987.1 uncharacterized protein DI09_31p110 [Mitosporidium daphniae]